MPGRRLLFLDASRLTAYRWQLGHLYEEGSFAADEAGLAAFAQYLGERRRSVFFLVADVAEEGFQIEDIPYVQGRDRLAVIKRKLGQYFYGTPLSVAVSLGRSKEGRRDEKLLFAALTRPQHFDSWLGALREAQAQLAGIFSMPMALSGLAAAYGRQYRQFLLISITRGGLRQSFCEDGQLRFSRLTPLATGSIEETAVAAAIESAKIYQYLAGQRLIARGALLPTLVLAHPAQMEAFRARCHDTGELRFELVDLVAESGHHGLKTPPSDSLGERLFLHLLIQHPPRHQFAPPAERHFYRLGQLRFGLRSAGLVALVAGLLFAAKNGVDYYSLAGQTAEVRADMATDRQRYDAILQTLPKIPITTDNLRTLIDRHDKLARRNPGVETAYRQLSLALQAAPAIELSRLDWSVTERDPESSAKGAPPPTKNVATGAFAVTDVYGQLPLGLVSDHRAQIDTINAFAERLRADPAVRVRILSLPFEIESGKSLKGGGEVTARVEAPKFSLRMIQRL